MLFLTALIYKILVGVTNEKWTDIIIDFSLFFFLHFFVILLLLESNCYPHELLKTEKSPAFELLATGAEVFQWEQ